MIRKLLRRLPVRVRCLILLPVILSLFFAPALNGLIICLWECGLKRLPLQMKWEYEAWWGATKKLLLALASREEQ